jgi:hypothetical protein
MDDRQKEKIIGIEKSAQKDLGLTNIYLRFREALKFYEQHIAEAERNTTKKGMVAEAAQLCAAASFEFDSRIKSYDDKVLGLLEQMYLKPNEQNLNKVQDATENGRKLMKNTDGLLDDVKQKKGDQAKIKVTVDGYKNRFCEFIGSAIDSLTGAAFGMMDNVVDWTYANDIHNSVFYKHEASQIDLEAQLVDLDAKASELGITKVSSYWKNKAAKKAAV